MDFIIREFRKSSSFLVDIIDNLRLYWCQYKQVNTKDLKMENIQTELLQFVENGIVINPVYESHKRGKNWLGVLGGKNSVDMQMIFQRIRGKNCSTEGLKPGMAIEFGGDYISSAGNRTPYRRIYVIQSINETGLTCIVYPTRAKAMKNRFKGE